MSTSTATWHRQTPVDALTAEMSVPAPGFGHPHVLRMFDILRRRLARMISGSEGAFAGYDQLQLLPCVTGPDERLACRGRVLSTADGRQRVAYEATLEPFDPRAAFTEGEGHRLVARGIGLTIGLDASPAEPATHIGHPQQALLVRAGEL